MNEIELMAFAAMWAPFARRVSFSLAHGEWHVETCSRANAGQQCAICSAQWFGPVMILRSPGGKTCQICNGCKLGLTRMYRHTASTLKSGTVVTTLLFRQGDKP